MFFFSKIFCCIATELFSILPQQHSAVLTWNSDLVRLQMLFLQWQACLTIVTPACKMFHCTRGNATSAFLLWSHLKFTMSWHAEWSFQTGLLCQPVVCRFSFFEFKGRDEFATCFSLCVVTSDSDSRSARQICDVIIFVNHDR